MPLPSLSPLVLDGMAAALEHAGVAIWSWDPDREQCVMRGARLSHERGLAIGRDALFAAIVDDDRFALRQALAEAVDGLPVDVRFRVKHDGGVRWLRLRGRREAGARIIDAVVVDVTAEATARAVEQRRRQQMIRQTQTLQRLTSRLVDGADLPVILARLCQDVAAALDVARASVWVFDDDGHHLRCLAQVCRDGGRVTRGATLAVAGVPRYLEALRRDRTIAADHAQSDPYTRERAASLAEDGVVSLLDAACRVGGQMVGVVCHDHVGAPRVWTPEEQSFAASVADAVSLVLEGHRRREVEHARTALEASLRQAQKMESLGLLAGGVAHDLNNLLTPILMGAEMLKADLADAAHTDLVDSIVSAAVDARELVSQLLAFSRKQVLDLRELDLSEEVRRALKLLRRTLPETIQIELSLASNLAVRADAGQLQQVVFNLAINARDAMLGGGQLRIATRATTVGDARFASIVVEDTGHGMDADTLPHIFEPFFTTKGVGRGTGLGLSTVYGIVQQHGGAIVVDSQPGRGARFEIRLPEAVPGSPRARRPSFRTIGPTRATVLVVEDEPAVRTLVARLLHREGYEVLDASSADEALELVARHPGPIGLLLTDVVMPGMNGQALFAAIQTSRPDTRVVYMSGYDRDVLAPQGVLSDDVRLIQKPFSAADLLRSIHEVLTAA